MSGPALQLTQLPIKCLPCALDSQVKRPGSEGNHSSPPRFEVKNDWSSTSALLNTLTVWSGMTVYLLILFVFHVSAFLISFIPTLSLFFFFLSSLSLHISPNCENVTLINTAVLFDRLYTLSLRPKSEGYRLSGRNWSVFKFLPQQRGWLLCPLTLSSEAWLNGLTRTIS